jgi:hypothetical protein
MSIMPGSATRSDAAISRLPFGSASPIAVMRSPSIAMSVRRVPSSRTAVTPRMTTSLMAFPHS